MIELLLYFLIVIVFYIYFGYPLLLLVKIKFFPIELVKKKIFLSVTIICSARNEEDVLKDFIENKLELDYPKDKYKVMIVSDASEDKTDEIINYYQNESKNIIYLRQSVRKGKTAALNLAVSKSDTEIIVFADANSMYEKDALQYLIQNFSDPKVGYATGRMIYLNRDSGQIGEGNSKYMQYENILREFETAANSVVGVDGGIDAVRRGLYKEMPEEAQPDFYLPLTIVEQGYRVVYEKNAVLKEFALDTSKDEYKMRVRVALRALRVLWKKKFLLNPFKYGFFSLQLFSHKVLRYFVGVFQIIIFILNILIVNQNIFLSFLFYIQVSFYLISLVSFFLEKINYKNNPLSMFYYFNLLNFSSLFALIKLLTGEKLVLWEPRKG